MHRSAAKRSLLRGPSKFMPALTRTSPSAVVHRPDLSILDGAIDGWERIRPGSLFGSGGEGHLRLVFKPGIPTIERGMERLAATFGALSTA